MKTILSIVFCLILFIEVEAQTKTARIAAGSSFVDVGFGTADTISATQATYTITIDAAQHFPTTQDLLVKLDSISGSKATVALQGSKFGTAYSAIGSTITWNGTASDTTIIISNATLNRYRYYKVIVTRTAGKAKLNDMKFKLYYE